MATLKDEHKVFIVQALACYDTPTQIAAAVKEVFGISVTRQQVESYNCKRQAGQSTAKKWVAIFNKTRDDFEAEIAKIPVALRAVRLRRLERYVDQAEASGNLVLAAQLLEQIAREQGGMYENRRIHVHSGPNGQPIQTESTNLNLTMSDAEADQRIAELHKKLGIANG